MRIIDLLNKIANGEEVPKEVKYCDETFTFNNDDCNFLYKYQVGKCQLFGCCKLNDTVEIIEEKKIPEKLETYKEFDDEDYYANILKVSKNGEYEIDEATLVIVDKINEVIDYLNSKGE